MKNYRIIAEILDTECVAYAKKGYICQLARTEFCSDGE